MNLTALIARLTELEGKAKEQHDCPSCHGRRPNLEPLWYCKVCAGQNRDPEDWKHLLDYTVAARDSVPTLLEALAIQREALEKLEQKTKGRKYNCSSGWVHQVTSRALARVDALAEKGLVKG